MERKGIRLPWVVVRELAWTVSDPTGAYFINILQRDMVNAGMGQDKMPREISKRNDHSLGAVCEDQLPYRLF